MLPSHHLTYFDILRYAQTKLSAPGELRYLSAQELTRYSQALESDESLSALIEKYPPFGGAFSKLVQASLNLRRAEEENQREQLQINRQGEQDVHLQVFSGVRTRAKQWLHDNFAQLAGNDVFVAINVLEQFLNNLELTAQESQETGLSDEEQQSKDKKHEFERFLQRAEEDRYQTRQRERSNMQQRRQTLAEIKQSLMTYFNYLRDRFRNHTHSGRAELCQLVYWAQQTSYIERFDRFEPIFTSIDDSRTSYHTDPGGGYSCMAGFAERCVDAAHIVQQLTLGEQPRVLNDGERWVSSMIDIMTSTDSQGAIVPSELLKAAYFKVAGYQARRIVADVWHRVPNFDEHQNACFQNYVAWRETQVQEKYEQLIAQAEQKKSEKNPARKIALMREMNNLKAHIKDYLRQDDDGFPLIPYERITDQSIVELIQQSDFDSQIERVMTSQQDLTEEQRSWGFETLFVRTQENHYEVINPEVATNRQQQIFERLSEEFFLGSGHAQLVFNLIGQRSDARFNDDSTLGMPVLEAMFRNNMVPQGLKQLLDAGRSPETAVGLLDTSWHKGQAVEDYQRYIAAPRRFIPLHIPQVNEAIYRCVLGDNANRHNVGICGFPVIKTLEPFMDEQVFENFFQNSWRHYPRQYWCWANHIHAPPRVRALRSTNLLHCALENALFLGDNDFLISLLSSTVLRNDEMNVILHRDLSINNNLRGTLIKLMFKNDNISVESILAFCAPEGAHHNLQLLIPRIQFQAIISEITNYYLRSDAPSIRAKKIGLIFDELRFQLSATQQEAVEETCVVDIKYWRTFEKMLKNHHDVSVSRILMNMRKHSQKAVSDNILQYGLRLLDRFPEYLNQQDLEGQTLMHRLVNAPRDFMPKSAPIFSRNADLPVVSLHERKSYFVTIFKTLLEKGPDLTLKDFRGKTAFDYIGDNELFLKILNGEEEIQYPCLKNAFSDPKTLRTALMLACPPLFVIKAFEDNVDFHQPHHAGCSSLLKILDINSAVSVMRTEVFDCQPYTNNCSPILPLLYNLLKKGYQIHPEHHNLVALVKRERWHHRDAYKSLYYSIYPYWLSQSLVLASRFDAAFETLCFEELAIRQQWDLLSRLMAHAPVQEVSPTSIFTLLKYEQIELLLKLWESISTPCAERLLQDYSLEIITVLSKNFLGESILLEILNKIDQVSAVGERYLELSEQAVFTGFQKALAQALEHERLDVVRALFQTLPEHMCLYGVRGIVGDHPQRVIALYQSFPDEQIKKTFAYLALRAACLESNEELAHSLTNMDPSLVNSSPVSQRNGINTTPLYEALCLPSGKMESMVRLLVYGCGDDTDKRLENNHGRAVLVQLLKEKHYVPAHYLISQDLYDLSIVDSDGYTFVDYVVGLEENDRSLTEVQMRFLQSLHRYINVPAFKDPQKILQALLRYDAAENSFSGRIAAEIFENHQINDGALFLDILPYVRRQIWVMRRLIHVGFMQKRIRIWEGVSEQILGAHLFRQACFHENWELAEALSQHDTIFVQGNGILEITGSRTALEDAIFARSVQKVAKIIDLGANVNYQCLNTDGYLMSDPPLRFALTCQAYAIAGFLVQHGADMSYVRGNECESAIDVLTQYQENFTAESVAFLHQVDGSYHCCDIGMPNNFFQKLLRYDSTSGSFCEQKACQLIQLDCVSPRTFPDNELIELLTGNPPALQLLVRERWAYVSDENRTQLLRALFNQPQEISLSFIRMLMKKNYLSEFICSNRAPRGIRRLIMWRSVERLIHWAARLGPQRPADVIKALCESVSYDSLENLQQIEQQITDYARAGDFLMVQNLMSHQGYHRGYLYHYMRSPSFSWAARSHLYDAYRHLTIEQVQADPFKSLSLLTIGMQLCFEGCHAGELKRAAIVAALAAGHSATEIHVLLEQEYRADKLKQASWWVRFLAFVGLYTPETPASYLNAVDAHSGETVLTQAVKSGKTDIVKKLYQAGADFSVRNNAGRTAWQDACDTASVQMNDLLRELGAAPSGQEVIVNNNDVQPSDRTASMLYSLGATPTTKLSQRIPRINKK